MDVSHDDCVQESSFDNGIWTISTKRVCFSAKSVRGIWWVAGLTAFLLAMNVYQK